MDLIKKLDELLSHLNSEENGMALEFKGELEKYIEESEESSLWLACLEGAGVDNWSGYGYAIEAFEEAKGVESDE